MLQTVPIYKKNYLKYKMYIPFYFSGDNEL